MDYSKLRGVEKLLFSKDVSDEDKWVIIQTMEEQFYDLLRNTDDEDIIEGIKCCVSKLWNSDDMEAWKNEASCYQVYIEDLDERE